MQGFLTLVECKRLKGRWWEREKEIDSPEMKEEKKKMRIGGDGG